MQLYRILKIMAFVLVLLVTRGVYAQQVNVKKGEVFLNKKPVVKLDNIKSLFTISDLQGKGIFSAQYHFFDLENGETKAWFVITDLVSGATNQIRNTTIGNSFSRERSIMTQLVRGDYKLITENGVDKKVLEHLMQSEQKDFEAVYLQQNDSILNELKRGQKMLTDLKVKISAKGEISKWTKSGASNSHRDHVPVQESIGTINLELVKPLNNRLYTISDQDDRVIASWCDFGIVNVANVTPQNVTNELLLSDGQKYKVKEIKKIDSDESLANNEMARKLVALVFVKGIFE